MFKRPVIFFIAGLALMFTIAQTVIHPSDPTKYQTVDIRDFGARCDGTTDDTAAFTAAEAATHLIQIPKGVCYIGSDLTLSAVIIGSPSSFAWSASPETEPYTLLVDPSVTISIVHGAGLDGVRITQRGVGAPTTLRQAIGAYAAFSGTAITCSAWALPTDTSDISFHRVFITGFNTAINKINCDRLFLQDVKIVSTNGINGQQCYDTCYWERVELWPFLGSFASVQDQSTSVSGAVNNGSGLIRLTLSSAPATALVTGDKVSVGRVGGVTNASGRWTITVIDSTHIDLQGSTFAGIYTSGGTVTLGIILSGTGVKLVNGSYEMHHITVFGWDIGVSAGSAITESWCSDCWIDNFTRPGDHSGTGLLMLTGMGTFSYTGFVYSSGIAVDVQGGALKITRSNIGGDVDSGVPVISIENAGSYLLMGQSAINTSGIIPGPVITTDSAYARVDLVGVVDPIVGDRFSIPTDACAKFYNDGIAGPCLWTPTIDFGGATTGWTFTSSGVYTLTINGLVTTEAEITITAKGSATGVVRVGGLPSNSVSLTGSCISPGNSGMTGLTGTVQGFTTLGAPNIQLGTQASNGLAPITDANFGGSSSIFLNCSYMGGI